ncbi:MAG TPA: 23S rRNA (uracil(1939)-C(5))-methyltransferase RlmD [Clostridiales bacterium]|nr:23S rRNA (uracil(1939)-C(5))-methyltransferase RlmD [Clostridiales bacterium]
MAEKLNKNQIVEIDITGMSHQGFGVGKVDDFVVFTEGALPGERIKARLVSIKKDYAYGIISEYIEKSPDRRDPFCPVYDLCGGCSLQHMSYESQLKNKTVRVDDCLKRIGGFTDIPVLPCIGMQEPYEYRNKVQLAVGSTGLGEGNKQRGLSAGFYARRTHQVVYAQQCRIQPGIADQIKDTVLIYMKSNKISAYDETKNKGLVRHIMVRKSVNTDDVMVVIVATENNRVFMKGLTDILLASFQDIKTVVLNLNTKATNVIMGNECVYYYGDGSIQEKLGDLTFRITPLSFFQVNTLQMKVLYDKVKEYAGLTGEEIVWDLYCGAGTIGLYLADQAKKVIGIESVPQAVENAKENTIQNNIRNTEFITGKAEDEINQLIQSTNNIHPDLIIVDPPRKGCHERLLSSLCELRTQKLIYVSCNPSTLARDLKYLNEHGKYEIKKVQPVDMFPWTEHVETVVLLKRLEK